MSLTCELVVTICVSVIAWHYHLKLILALTVVKPVVVCVAHSASEV